MNAYVHLEYLVTECGDRRVGSAGAAKAADYIVSTLEAEGFTCEAEPFASVAGVHAPNALAMALGAAASFLMSRRNRAARVLGFVAGALMVSIMLGVETTRLNPYIAFLPKKNGMNVLARWGSGPPTAVLVAHYDTINEGEAFRPERVRLVPLGAYVQGLMPVLTMVLGPFHRKLPGHLLRAALLGGAFTMLHWQYYGRPNAGANDNGSGVAAALDSAISIGADAAAAANIWFLFTDGEEAALSGMVEFCCRHSADLADAVILNLESVGGGTLTALGRESMIVSRRPPRWLLEEVTRFAARSGLRLKVMSRATLATDSVAALARGVPAVTLAGLGDNGLIDGWHFNDVLENIDRDKLEQAAGFAAALLAELASVGNLRPARQQRQ